MEAYNHTIIRDRVYVLLISDAFRTSASEDLSVVLAKNIGSDHRQEEGCGGRG